MGNLTVFQQSLSNHRTQLEKYKGEFLKVLPPHVTPDRLIRSVTNALVANEYLATSATPESVVRAAMTAAVLGLDVDNVTGQGYIVPFKGKAQFVPGYKGYISLAANAGWLVSGDVVRERDAFRYGRGLNPFLDHIPAAGGPKERGNIIYAYATARHAAIPPDFHVLHISQVNAIRDRSEGYKAFLKGKTSSTPWESDFEPMAIKTAIRACAPRLPLSVQRAAAVEGAYDRGNLANLTESGNVTLDIIEQMPDGKTDGPPDLVKDLGLEEPPPPAEAKPPKCATCRDKGSVPFKDSLTGEEGVEPCRDCRG